MTRFQLRNRIAAQLGYVPATAGTIARHNRLQLACEILEQPRRLRRYEAVALKAAYQVAKADAEVSRVALQVQQLQQAEPAAMGLLLTAFLTVPAVRGWSSGLRVSTPQCDGL